MEKVLHINAVAFEDHDVWIVQGIEYDISAFAKHVNEIPMAFMKAVTEHVCITNELGREPLQGIKPAPLKFKTMFDSAKAKVSSLDEMPTLMGSQPSLNIRLVAA